MTSLNPNGNATAEITAWAEEALRTGDLARRTEPEGLPLAHLVCCLPEAAGMPLLKRLISAGAPLADPSAAGRPPAHFAAASGRAAALEALGRAGAPLGARDSEGATPAHHAACNGHATVLEVLHRAGASLSERNGGGATPAHLAAFQGHAAALQALDLAGAYLGARTVGGYTPAEMAATHGRRDALRVLWLAGADCDSKGIQRLAAQHGQADVFVDATPADAALRRVRAAARRGELREEHAALLEEVVGAGAPAGTSICVTKANVCAIRPAVRAEQAAAEPYLAQRAEVRAALLPALVACLRARGAPAAVAGTSASAAEPANRRSRASGTAAPVPGSACDALGHTPPMMQPAKQGPSRRVLAIGPKARLHVPAASALRRLRRVRAARVRAEALRAEAPQWLRDGVTMLAASLVGLRDLEASG